jgi:probable rRNA maturation factor
MMPVVMGVDPHEINIRIKRGLKIALSHTWLRGIVSKALVADDTREPVELGVVITDSTTVRLLNKTYRFKDEPTDVLAFRLGLRNNDEAKTHFVSPPDGVTHLGEVVISYPVAVQQAREHGHSIEQELALLTVHGVLHLLGYDHKDVRERRGMRAKEKRILGILGYNN